MNFFIKLLGIKETLYWRKISTAPLDGTIIILWRGCDPVVPGYWDKESKCWEWYGDIDSNLIPEMWMPLPTGPE